MDYTEKITHLFNVPAEHAVPIASFVNSLGVDGVRASASGSDLILTRRIAGGSCDDGDKWKAWSDLIDAIFEGVDVDFGQLSKLKTAERSSLLSPDVDLDAARRAAGYIRCPCLSQRRSSPSA